MQQDINFGGVGVRTPTTKPVLAPRQQGNAGLTIYLIFIASWFLHLPARIPALGLIRADLMLVAVLTFLAANTDRPASAEGATISRRLRILLLYALVTIPFVEWPGSVVKIGFPNFLKAVVFFYFTAIFVRSVSDLRRLLTVFIVCQALRIVEPVILHFTEGYWGSSASMNGGTEFLDRLSGGPYDVVNPNGLAFLVCTAFPFLYYLAPLSRLNKLGFALLAPILLTALALTGSRSGMVGFATICLTIIWKSRRKLVLGTVFAGVVAVAFTQLSPDMQDRYLSIVGMGERNAATAEERMQGMNEYWQVVFHRPIFGHGLGTSAEANYHFTSGGPYGGRAIPAHNLYLEVAEELGLVGLAIYLPLLVAILRAYANCRKLSWPDENREFVQRVLDAMQVWLVMTLIFSFASYGLSNFDWYFFGGITVALQRMASSGQLSPAAAPASAIVRAASAAR